MTRMFAALPLPQHVSEDLGEFLDPRLQAFDVRWTRAWHLTLAFVADVPDRALDRLLERLEAACARRAPVRLRLAGSGAFPDPFAARVLFLSPEHGDSDRLELTRIASACRTAATTSGLVVDGARFVPHVTLARTPRPYLATRWLQVLDTYRGPEWIADRVELVASHTTDSRRRRHEVVGEFALGSGEVVA